jgi:hypothetical protein
MDNEVKPTWKLAWGMWWRMFLITLGISVVIGLILCILVLVGVKCIPWESCWGWLPGL